MIIGIIESQNVHLDGFGVYVLSRAQVAQSQSATVSPLVV
jgi:hypothetical protein